MRTKYFGATFKDRPEHKNDGVVMVPDPERYSRILGIPERDAASKAPTPARMQHDNTRETDDVRKRKQTVSNLTNLREQDMRRIVSIVARRRELREERFQGLLASTHDRQGVVEALDAMLGAEAEHRQSVRQGLYDKWVDEVFRPIQHGIKRLTNPLHAKLITALFDEPIQPVDSTSTVTLPKDADPLKQELRSAEKERKVLSDLERVLWEHSGVPEPHKVVSEGDARLDPVHWNPVLFFGGRFMQKNPQKRRTALVDRQAAGRMREGEQGGKRCWMYPPGSIPRTMP